MAVKTSVAWGYVGTSIMRDRSGPHLTLLHSRKPALLPSSVTILLLRLRPFCGNPFVQLTQEDLSLASWLETALRTHSLAV